MRGQFFIVVIVLAAFILLVDLYAFRGVNNLSHSFSSRQRFFLQTGFWLVTATGIIWLAWLWLSMNSFTYERMFRVMTAFMGFFILFYVPKLFFNIFQLVQDISALMARGVRYASGNEGFIAESAGKIERSTFILQFGLILAAIPFISIVNGIARGRYNYRVRNVKLGYPNLPPAFEGLRFVQISDLHIGSFAGNPGKVEKAVELVNRQNPDYILFTGDMVNNKASEMKEFIPVLKKLKAKNGKYSILGNHDYGEHYNWSSEQERRENMEALFEYQKESGFRLLNNEAVVLKEKDNEIALIGVENWGIPPFPQHGDLQKAIRSVKDVPFKILMSHDPSHWDAEVLSYKDIDLTLSGHTHGMQFAINIPGWKWSPVQIKYPRWGGLYQVGKQALYVNIGLGYIAFPGRVGTPPEITVFELSRSVKDEKIKDSELAYGHSS